MAKSIYAGSKTVWQNGKQVLKIFLKQTADPVAPAGRSFVYHLIHPKTLKPFYVGQTRTPRKRLLGHCRALKPFLPFVPEMVIQTECDLASVNQLEAAEVKRLIRRGIKLMNVNLVF